MQSATSKRWVTNLALVLALVACSSGKQLHGTHEDLPGGHVLQMKRMSATFGWVVTDRRFVSTKDAGKTWNDLTPVDAPGNSIRAAFFLDESHVWCAAFTGKTVEVYRSDTRGRSWKKTSLPGDYAAGVQRVLFDFEDARNATLFVERPGRPDVYVTSDAGVTWTLRQDPDDVTDVVADPVPISTPEPGTRVIYSKGEVLLVRAQEVQARKKPASLPDAIAELSFPTVTHGWAVSAEGCPKLNGGCEPRRLFATEDGGATWTRLIP